MTSTAAITRRKVIRRPEHDLPKEIMIRGRLAEYRNGKAHHPLPITEKRGEVRHMTDASRLRMLKFVATIDLGKASKSVFVTLTYPPEREVNTHQTRTKQRKKFMRYIEKHLGRKVAGLWRVEWLPRESGATQGEIAPHIHMLLFDVRWLPKEKVNEWWRKTIVWEEYCRTEIKRTRKGKQTAYYAAKYCGKRTDGSLVYGAYLDRVKGRHWGYLRGKLIPREPITWILEPSETQLDYMLKRANDNFKAHDIRQGESFTLLGEYVDDMRKILHEMGLTQDRGNG